MAVFPQNTIFLGHPVHPDHYVSGASACADVRPGLFIWRVGCYRTHSGLFTIISHLPPCQGPDLTLYLMVQECPRVMARVCSAGTVWRGGATSRAVTASRIVPVSYLIISSVMMSGTTVRWPTSSSVSSENLHKNRSWCRWCSILTLTSSPRSLSMWDTPSLTRSDSKHVYQHFISTLAKVSAIGGTFGLFCGVSVISLLELLYYLVVFLWRATSRKKKMESSEKLMLQPNNRFN